MKVYGFMKEKDGVMKMENTLEVQQAFVGGFIENVEFTEELDLVCNAEGKGNHMEPSAVWMEDGELLDVICGNCFICRYDLEGKCVSIEESDVEVILEKLKPIAKMKGKLDV